MQHSPEFLALVDDAKRSVAEIDVPGLRRRQQSGHALRVVDVREDREWQQGHIPGAEHIGRGVLERDAIAQLADKQETIVLYCGGGFRSALAGASLQAMGYTDVLSLAGGWKAWNSAGLPVSQDP